jgi:C-terminal processing protease CtpA/Prc
VSVLRGHAFVEYRTPEPEGPAFRGERVVLVGPRCYSCGEVLAQAMKEHAGATLVGATTAGMVVAADQHDLGDGYGLLLPFADMESGQGYRIESRGVAPHLEADLEGLEGEALLDRVGEITRDSF